ncbi:antA/AntB antirepressor family protein [Aeromonas caviae]|uniref:antA/AntB antirepressor family protein n=1 Tax=Aeromonas caviae TaxID=648 RepID=UPI00244AF1E8|nr:antA/AntB antirepressor family protein [Aeromonas caviae]MDH0316072.1 antA/AntB antirepressor family protein [Aeromonas caviae]MDH1448290.1 antA/AntB antirepressor family protein [Aeromonas caviae]MDH1452153.1 antA/AntB antirepressor family protein [Aeromonas caviae]MDH1495460.1 antA/AntB antirepressor family protein [Aeromonas caviae]
MQKQYGLIAQGEALPKNSNVENKTIAELLPVHLQQTRDGKELQAVNARELHTFLKVGRDFSNWIKDRIDEYEFLEGLDYIVFAKSGGNPKGGRPQKEYVLTMSTAKELAMVERNDEGRRARHYFIECERRLSIVAPEQQAAAVTHWQAQREVTKDYHGLMCRALQQVRLSAGKETRAHHYSNELNMLNRLVLGVDAKHWSELHGGCREVRQHMDSHQLEQIAYLERSNATLIDAGMPFAERKARLSSMLAAHVEREGRA